MIKKILIGVDDSRYAENAAEYGFGLAQLLSAEVGLVNIVEPIVMPYSNTGADEILGTPMQGMNPGEVELLQARAGISDSILERFSKKFGGALQVTNFNEYGSTGEGIINCAAEFNAGLIVIGTHEKGGFERLISRDVAEYVVRHSVIPVLVVPTKE